MEGMKEHKVFVLVGETGSGKTTQVKLCYRLCRISICRLSFTVIQIYLYNYIVLG